MATTKITNPELFDLASLNTTLKLPSGTTAERPTSPSTGEWRYNTTTNLVEFWDGGQWRQLQSEDIPPIPSEHFNTVLYSGTGSAQSITGVGFKPDLVWIKERSGTAWHSWFDTTRGVGNRISSNSVNAQNFDIQRLSSFDADGFSLGIDGDVNGSGKTFVAWCWKAGGGTTSSNTDGTITSDVQANTKTGFSLVKFTGTGANGTVGHGLGVAPEIIIFKNYPAISGWKMFTNQTPSPATQVMELQDASGFQTPTNPFNSTLPSSSVFSLGTYGDVNASGGTFIAYCFASVAGYSSIGSYTGNGSTNGPIVNTGFEPAFVIIKRTDVADNWSITDNKRNTTNPRNKALFPNLSSIELTSGYTVDYLSNGFQIKSTDNAMNANGGTYLYIAFGSDASAAPALANSFTTNLYTGNSDTQILGTGFQPSLVWIKDRSVTRDHNLTDSVRGVTHPIYITTGAQLTNSTFLTSFNTDGFSLGNQAASNENLEDFVAWNWKANPIPNINTDGDTQTIVSANQAAGFSIVSFNKTTNSSTASTFGHGLGVAPEMIILKRTDGVEDWYVYNTTLGNAARIQLNSSDAQTTGTNVWGQTDPTSTVFTVESFNAGNAIAYCFKSTAGFSKIGTYTGNGSTQSITGLGFEPNWVLIKETSAAESWRVFDSARGATKRLFPNTNGAESTASDSLTAFDSDGFSLGSSAGVNENTQTYIYMAFKNNRGFASDGTMAFTVVAGGGGGGASQGGGTQFSRTGCGGGAGGFRGSGDITGGRCAPQDNINLASGTYTVTVGAGGSPRVSGSASSIAGPSLTTISTVGGGRGADDNNQPENGGSGGGRSYYSSANGYSTTCEGYGRTLEGVTSWQAGGGGAGGIQVSLTAGLKSGIGVNSVMSGTYVFYAGGGAPGSANTTRPQAAPGGGGNGQISGETAANTPAEITGTANTGGGGGGGSNNTTTGAKGDGGSGGSGIVMLRLKTSEYSGTTTGSPTVTTDGDETIIQFTGSGTYVHS